MSDEGELVPVMVPKRHLPAVYRFVGDLDLKPSSNQSENGDPWTEARIIQGFKAAEPDMQAVFKYLAARPETRVPSKELVGFLGHRRGTEVTSSTLAGVIGGFAKIVTNQFGLRNSRGNAILPFNHPRDRNLKSRVYIMSDRVAQIIKAL